MLRSGCWFVLSFVPGTAAARSYAKAERSLLDSFGLVNRFLVERGEEPEPLPDRRPPRRPDVLAGYVDRTGAILRAIAALEDGRRDVALEWVGTNL